MKTSSLIQLSCLKTIKTVYHYSFSFFVKTYRNNHGLKGIYEGGEYYQQEKAI